MEKKHRSFNNGNPFIDQKLNLSPQLSHNDTVPNDATTHTFSQYQCYPPDAPYPYYAQDTLPYFSFLCQHLILVFKFVLHCRWYISFL